MDGKVEVDGDYGKLEVVSRIGASNNLYRQIIIQLMKRQHRPQSAKHGSRVHPLQSSADEIREEDAHYKHPNRKQVKLMKPDLLVNDFARIMPKKIFQDKEKLYSEGLQLKQKLNQFQEENVRLKTRISILEKEKDKLTKAIDMAAESSNKSQSRFKAYQVPNKPCDLENTRVRNLTKMIRQSKQQNDYLKQENAKIKKAIKFTKINEVEIECKILRDEYQKLQEILADMTQKLTDQEDYEREISDLKNYLEEEVQENKQLSESNQKYVEYIDELEQKLKKQAEKFKQRENKLLRENALHRRKLNQAIKISDELRKQIRTMKQASQNLEAKKKQMPTKNIVRPQTSNPYSRPDSKQQQINSEAQVKLEELRLKNQNLERELKQIRQKLQKSEKDNRNAVSAAAKIDSNAKQNQKKPEMTGTQNLRVNSEPKEDYENEDFQNTNSPQKKNDAHFVLKEETKVKEDDYYEQFEEESPKKKVDDHIENYKKDLEDENGEEEEIYKKDESQDKMRNKTEKNKENNKSVKEADKKGGYQPDKKILSQIKQLLTYRMKAQRYPFKDLKNDISSSPYNMFSYAELQNMMKSEPFHLSPGYTKTFLEYVFERKDKAITEQSVSSDVLLNKLRKVVKDFELLDEKEEEERLMSIAEMTTQYPNQLQSAFQKIKNGPDTVAKKDLIEMFKKLELADHFIEIIIAQLSMCSQDLEHLSIRGYFQRFYIDEIENSNAIDEEQIESSGEQSPAKSKTKKIHKIDEEDEYEEDKVNFIMEDEGELSMRGKGKNQTDSNEDLISDDGRI